MLDSLCSALLLASVDKGSEHRRGSIYVKLPERGRRRRRREVNDTGLDRRELVTR